jgi:hypothetical protein
MQKEPHDSRINSLCQRNKYSRRRFWMYDEGMAHLRRRLIEGDPKVNCFHEDVEGTS